MSAARPRLRLGTRGSPLALWQARAVADRLGRMGVGVETVLLRSAGDRDTARPLAEFASPAPFADEIERALAQGAIDAGVHSLKDLPLAPTPGLTLAAMPVRGARSESLVSKDGRALRDLAPGARVGASCARRAAQLRRLRPDLVAVPIRGAVEQRVRQVKQGAFDAAVLATAGLERLGLEHVIAETFPIEEFTPAPGQGVLAVQIREGDAGVGAVVSALDDSWLRAAAETELAVQRAFEPSKDWTVAAAAHADASGVALFVRLLGADGAASDARAREVEPQRAVDAAVRRLRAA